MGHERAGDTSRPGTYPPAGDGSCPRNAPPGCLAITPKCGSSQPPQGHLFVGPDGHRVHDADFLSMKVLASRQSSHLLKLRNAIPARMPHYNLTRVRSCTLPAGDTVVRSGGLHDEQEQDPKDAVPANEFELARDIHCQYTPRQAMDRRHHGIASKRRIDPEGFLCLIKRC